MRAYILTFVIAFACCCLGSLDVIAPLVTDFYLITYLLLNLSCFLGDLSKTPGWRPSFKYYHKYFSLFGTILCFAFIILSGWEFAIGAFLIAFLLYVYIDYCDVGMFKIKKKPKNIYILLYLLIFFVCVV